MKMSLSMKPRLLSVVFVLVITQSLLVSGASASGLLVVSGDSNIGIPIDGAGGLAPINLDNATWFTSILGAGTTVKIQNDDTISFGDSSTSINTLYNSLTGVTSSIVTAGTTIDNSLLAGVDLYLYMVPTDDFSVAELNSFSGFLSGGGSLFLLGDNQDALNVENSRINGALAFLGSGMSIIDDTLDCGFNTTTNISADPLNGGISSFSLACASQVSGGTSLINSKDDLTFIAYETQVVPIPAAAWLFGSALGFLGWMRRKKIVTLEKKLSLFIELRSAKIHAQ